MTAPTRSGAVDVDVDVDLLFILMVLVCARLCGWMLDVFVLLCLPS